ncbi:MAG TPA: TrmH family RNA methyltransferase, partial [Candidatus Saccharimonadales bacterium]|nr:TrmH family RNA methyltransferase [Candidatus Saccharimonadales bacterium]
TCEGLGVSRIIVSGYSPYPKLAHDTRLPHISSKLTSQIHKTALDAETIVPFEYQEHPDLDALKTQGYRIVGLEQAERSIMLPDYKPPEKIALLLGEEVNGITDNLLAQCDDLIEIPIHGQKESFNVSVAAGIALYALTSLYKR